MLMNTPPPDIHTLLDLSGKRALVTGAAGGLGQGIARRLSEAGAEVVIHYHTSSTAAQLLADSISKATLIQADLTSDSAVDKLFQQLDAQTLIPDIVVNNAAQQPVEPLTEMTLTSWRQIMAANLDSAFLVTQAAARHMRKRNQPGSIVNIASIEGLDPAAGHAHYTTTKAGLLMFTRTCALEYGGDNIRVNAISPGLIYREGLENAWPEGVERWQSNAPLTRLGTPEDIGDAVLFLASSAARWISGANLVVDGGMSANSRW
ncbi:MAG: SDR family NAD(P)-dependent oxidoreductase [Pseudomonadota bacterium]